MRKINYLFISFFIFLTFYPGLASHLFEELPKTASFAPTLESIPEENEGNTIENWAEIHAAFMADVEKDIDFKAAIPFNLSKTHQLKSNSIHLATSNLKGAL